MKTGVIMPLDNDKAVYKRLTWTEKGDGLAILKGKEDEDYEDKLFSVISFSDFSSDLPKKVSYDPKDDKDFPEEMTISPNRSPVWTEDFSGILFGIHGVKKKEDKEKKDTDKEKENEKAEDKNKEKKAPLKKKSEEEIDKEDLPDVVIWHWQDKRLQSLLESLIKTELVFTVILGVDINLLS